jgi:hypothetical protein
MIRKQQFIFALIGFLTLSSWAQEKPKEISELRYNLNEDGTHFLKATFLNQVWLRYSQSNPGTTVLGDNKSETTDIGLRRTRFQFFGQLTDHVTFYFQFGQNNFNFLSGQNAANSGNRKNQVFFHDALTEYRVWKGEDHLFVGGGLTIANGLSRFSQPSIGTIMSMDVPVFAQATVDQTDEFSRKLSVYARGQLNKLDYRVVVSDPFPVTSNGLPQATISTTNATFAYNSHHKQYQSFLVWNFFEKESHVTPYMTGTYLGKKKVLNLEAGFILQKNATWTGDNVAQFYHNMNLWSVAMFYDAPVNREKGNAINAYAGYFHTDYGPGYLRYNGIMNPANGVTVGYLAGSQGNAFPMFGTGSVMYAQFGYLFKRDLLGSHGALMPYATWQSANYDRLNKIMNVYDFGVNWLINGHNAKMSLDYQLRPTYTPTGTDLVRDKGMKGQLVMQYQISF